MEQNPNNYNYLFLKPRHFARFSKDITNSQLEVYQEDQKVWVIEDNVRMIKRFNQDSDQISYEEFVGMI